MYTKSFCNNSQKKSKQVLILIFLISRKLKFCFTLIQRTKVVEFWNQVKSTIQVQRKFWQFFSKADGPAARPTRRTAAKFSTLRTACSVKQRHSDRKKCARSIENVDCLRELVGGNPRKSIRRLSPESNIHRASVQHIFRNGLHLFPCKSQSRSEHFIKKFT